MCVPSSVLDAYLGKAMGDICHHAPARAAPQHRGAQFIGHLIRAEFKRDSGCRACMPDGTDPAVVPMGVERLFHRCGRKGPWDERPMALDPCLVFVAPAMSVRHLEAGWMMACSPRNQVGLYAAGRVWWLGERRHAVVVDTVAAFFDQCGGRSPAARAAMEFLYGEIPA